MEGADPDVHIHCTRVHSCSKVLHVRKFVLIGGELLGSCEKAVEGGRLDRWLDGPWVGSVFRDCTCVGCCKLDRDE